VTWSCSVGGILCLLAQTANPGFPEHRGDHILTFLLPQVRAQLGSLEFLLCVWRESIQVCTYSDSALRGTKESSPFTRAKMRPHVRPLWHPGTRVPGPRVEGQSNTKLSMREHGIAEAFSTRTYFLAIFVCNYFLPSCWARAVRL
jgi:hypothetical protein